MSYTKEEKRALMAKKRLESSKKKPKKEKTSKLTE